jgi:hypothetical protein
MDIVSIINILVPGAKYKMSGNSYSDIHWEDERAIPSEEEIANGLSLLKYRQKLKAVESQRQHAYMQTSDPLFFKWQRGLVEKQEWLDSIKKIKARFPKPEEPS